MFYLLLHYYVHVVPDIWILTLCVAFLPSLFMNITRRKER